MSLLDIEWKCAIFSYRVDSLSLLDINKFLLEGRS